MSKHSTTKRSNVTKTAANVVCGTVPRITESPNAANVVPLPTPPAPREDNRVSSALRTIEAMAVDAREQMGIVLLDLFDREHATAGGMMVLHEPLAAESVDALRQTVSGLVVILQETRELLRMHGVEPDLEGKFALPSVGGKVA